MRRVVAFTTVPILVVALVAAYLALDVLGLAPGVLTRDPVAPGLVAQRLPQPGSTSPPLAVPAPDAPEATEAGLRSALAASLADPSLGTSLGISIGDALTGTSLLEVDPATARTPASTTKLLTAAAVGATLDPELRLVTRVVQGSDPTDLVLVAGGDTLLAAGGGDPEAVAGRAGVGDLAQQVAAAVGAGGTTSVRLRLDLSYAAGPQYPATWNPADVTAGYTQGVSMIGLESQRPRVFMPSPTDPGRQVLRVLAKQLQAQGITAKLPTGSGDDSAASGAAVAEDAPVLGSVESAPLSDVLEFALATSDNAMTEGLARQAAASVGARTATTKETAAWVVKTVTDLGVDTTGVRLLDTSGLSSGQMIPARTLAEVLALSATGTSPALSRTVAGLPVAGVDGTLSGRFEEPGARSAAGLARAKTGTLTGASALAGTVVDRDGRLLTFVLLADAVPASTGTLGAQAALDRFVATITACGCR